MLTIEIGKPGALSERCQEARRLAGKVILKREQKGAVLMVASDSWEKRGKGV